MSSVSSWITTAEDAKVILKHKIIAVAAKIKQFINRTTQHHYNKPFNKKKPKKNLQSAWSQEAKNTYLDADKSQIIWNNIWENACKHNQNARWLSEVKVKWVMGKDENASTGAQQRILMMVEMVQNTCKRMSPWRAARPYRVQERGGEGEKGQGGEGARYESERAGLISKYPVNGNIPLNFFCSIKSTSYKAYEHMTEKNLLTWEQKKRHKKRKKNKRTTSNWQSHN